MTEKNAELIREARLKNITIESINSSQATQITQVVESPGSNTSISTLKKHLESLFTLPIKHYPDDAVTF